MNRIVQSLVLGVSALTVSQPLHAKRFPPKPVAPIQLQGVEYSVPHGDQMGFVVATDIKSKTILWAKQIYTVWIEPSLEQDVQCVYITGIKSKGSKLLVTNEKGFEYELDLNTLTVRTLKGGAVLRQQPQ